MEQAISIYITTSSEEEAENIALSLLENRLVACVNVLPKVKSFYWWEENIIDDSEVVMIAKSKESLFDQIEKKVKEEHSYDCPCIVAYPIVKVSEDYLSWINKEAK